MIDRFHHLLVAPAQYDASLAFYRDVLGWTVSKEWGQGGNRAVMLSGGGMKLALTERMPAALAGLGPAAGRPILHLDIHDIDARFRTLPAGANVVIPPGPTPWGTRWFVLRDPDGNLIAFEELHGGGH